MSSKMKNSLSLTLWNLWNDFLSGLLTLKTKKAIMSHMEHFWSTNIRLQNWYTLQFKFNCRKFLCKNHISWYMPCGLKMVTSIKFSVLPLTMADTNTTRSKFYFLRDYTLKKNRMAKYITGWHCAGWIALESLRYRMIFSELFQHTLGSCISFIISAKLFLQRSPKHSLIGSVDLYRASVLVLEPFWQWCSLLLISILIFLPSMCMGIQLNSI